MTSSVWPCHGQSINACQRTSRALCGSTQPSLHWQCVCGLLGASLYGWPSLLPSLHPPHRVAVCQVPSLGEGMPSGHHRGCAPHAHLPRGRQHSAQDSVDLFLGLFVHLDYPLPWRSEQLGRPRLERSCVPSCAQWDSAASDCCVRAWVPPGLARMQVSAATC